MLYALNVYNDVCQFSIKLGEKKISKSNLARGITLNLLYKVFRKSQHFIIGDKCLDTYNLDTSVFQRDENADLSPFFLPFNFDYS